MSSAARRPAVAPSNWKDLLDAAIFETDPEKLIRRIQQARDAIMDEIEDSLQTASSSERQALIRAMNAVHKLETMSKNTILSSHAA
jgi:hypothetical protein